MNSRAPWIVSATLFALMLWLGSALVRVENERYALAVGLCKHDATTLIMFDCLKTARSRTSWWWHAFYALKG
ncbi:MAG: hypothetical protein EON54_01270 [Alcaligenaceae bacterium]|nr:MAG: hypothetical protein EON54_01270 [Alcaligenaceae bacterium]